MKTFLVIKGENVFGGFPMSEEEQKIPDDVKKELLKKTKDDGFRGGIEAAKAKLEGKIPTKPKEE
jgi:hypothetical protein